MRSAKSAALATAINLGDAVILISSYTLGRKYLLAGTAITLVGNALAINQFVNNRIEAIVLSILKTSTGLLDLGIFILAKKGLTFFQAGSKIAGSSLIAFGGGWTLWRIGVDSLNIGEPKIGVWMLPEDLPIGFVDSAVIVAIERSLDRLCCISNESESQ